MNRKQKRRLERGAFLTVIAILIFFLGGWIFSMTNLFGCNGGCCTARATVSTKDTFNVDGNASFYPGLVGLQTIIIDPLIVSIIKDNDLQSEAQFIAFMNANYPDAVLSYFGMIWLYFGDARILADFDYANMSITGLGTTICLPGTFFAPYAEIVVNYENGTEFGDFTVPLFDPADVANISLSDLVNATYNMPTKYVFGCSGILDIQIESYDSVHEEFTLMINGDELIVPIE